MLTFSSTKLYRQPLTPKKVMIKFYFVNLITIFLIVNISAKPCVSQSDCVSEGPSSVCVFTSAASANTPAQGTCSAPTATSSTVSVSPSPTTTVTIAPSSCGNSTISGQCSFGQLCINEACVNAGDAAKNFFTPTMIAIFVAGAVVLLLGPILLCFCCKCCCFAGRRIGRGAKKIVAAPFHQQDYHQQDHHQRPAPYGASMDPSFHPSNNQAQSIKRDSIVSSQKLGPVPSYAGNSVPLFHTEERIEYLPIILSANNSNPPKKEEPFQFVPYDQYLAPVEEPVIRNPYTQGPLPLQINNQFNQSLQLENQVFHTHQQPIPGTPLSNSFKALDSPDISRESLPMSPQTPQMNQKVGPVGADKEPPLEKGYWGFWDKKCRYHQGYTDSNQSVHGGVFDDLCYFHFNTVGDSEPVLVDDSMISGYNSSLVETNTDPVEYHYGDSPDSESRLTGSFAPETNGKSQIDIGLAKQNLLSVPYESQRERGESMDVLGAPSLVPSNDCQYRF